MNQKTPYTLHIERWNKGCGSILCSQANRICLGRGTVPSDICFVAEAPGEAEDTIGYPMAGPAGMLLDEIIAGIIPDSLTYSITNLVGCIPRTNQGGKQGEPEIEDVQMCSKRLQEFLLIANPRLLVLVGKLAEHYLTPGYRHSIDVGSIPRVTIWHPAYILRRPFGDRGMLKAKCIVTIRDAIEEHMGIEL